eukprot:scaffold116320_cov91-Phaeocystis_antarctica.AAC.1
MDATVTSTMRWWFSSSVSAPAPSTFTFEGTALLKLSSALSANQSNVPVFVASLNRVLSSNVSATAAWTAEPRLAVKLYEDDAPLAESTAAVMRTGVSLTVTVRETTLPSKVACRVDAPALSERSRDEPTETTAASLELNELCEVTVTCEASESTATTRAVACWYCELGNGSVESCSCCSTTTGTATVAFRLEESAGTLTSTSIDVQLAPAINTTCTSPCTDAHAADAAARLTLSRASDEKSLLVPSS